MRIFQLFLNFKSETKMDFYGWCGQNCSRRTVQHVAPLLVTAGSVDYIQIRAIFLQSADRVRWMNSHSQGVSINTSWPEGGGMKILKNLFFDV